MTRYFDGTNQALAERLRFARLKAGYSQQNVADALNINRATYTYYETGKTSPDPVTLGKIARIFGVPIDFFFEEEKESLVYLSDRDRCPKKVEPDPEKIGQLSADEKTLIALLRGAHSVSLQETIYWVKKVKEQRNES